MNPYALQERIWADAERLPLEPCSDHWHGDSPEIDARRRLQCPTCNGTGQVRSALYESVKLAVTVPCDRVGHEGTLTDGTPPKGNCDWCGSPWSIAGRVVRPAPGEVLCPNSYAKVVDGFEIVCIGGRLSVDGQGYLPDETCGGSGTVPGTDEASEVARLEACGRLRPIVLLLNLEKAELPTPEAYETVNLALHRFVWALADSDHHGALEAVAKVLALLVPQAATT